MRGAGASFAIATEILYTIYPEPETQPAIFLGEIGPQGNCFSIYIFQFGSTA